MLRVGQLGKEDDMDENVGHIQESEQDRQIRNAEHQGATFLEKAEALEVLGDEDFAAAAAQQVYMKSWIKRAEGFMKPMVDAAYKAHQVLTTRRRELTDPATKACKIYARKMGIFQEEMERERQRAEAIEQARLDKEAQEEADAAAAMVADTEPELAQAISENLPKQVAVVKSIAPTYQGTTRRTNWLFRIVDADAIPREYMIPDEKAIGAIVRAKKGQVKIAGIEPYSETNVH